MLDHLETSGSLDLSIAVISNSATPIHTHTSSVSMLIFEMHMTFLVLGPLRLSTCSFCVTSNRSSK